MTAHLKESRVAEQRSRRFNTGDVVKVLTSCVLLGIAGLFAYSHFQRENASGASDYFYDLSERKLFVAPRSSIPPIEGLNKGQFDGVRAVLISTNGNYSDKKTRGIAYLEKYSPEFKQQIQEVQKAGAAAGSLELRIGRGQAADHVFVRRVGEDKWYTRASPEGQQIMTEWQVEGRDSQMPVLYVP